MSYSLDVINLYKQFGEKKILQNLQFQLGQGESLSIVGPSGSGKTTLLRILAGLESPTHGTIMLNGKNVTHHKPNTRNVGLVFQQPLLFPHMTVKENIDYGAKMAGQASKSKTAYLLRAINLDDYSDRFPAEISGGQQQRVALARAIASEPEVLLLDEPFSSLDVQLREELRYWVKDFLSKQQTTTIFVTHDLEEAILMGDRIAIFHEGIFQQLDEADEIHKHPGNPFVARFLKSHLVIDEHQYIPIQSIRSSKPEGEHHSYTAKLLNWTYNLGQKACRLYIDELHEIITMPMGTSDLKENFSIYLPLEKIQFFQEGWK
ncbi:heme ABC exporter ATP-binding protein CcmA [Halobacillus ihumii]|uniref:heme ABC exporter ATP-binding protein CcmA n=1 Tax=Halobacillus ihumii TaxID=2686092 RepID=UPI0013D2D398|nr:heme ABC exporter ATP-binding protein CcmA [Halobacillus ihumii]